MENKIIERAGQEMHAKEELLSIAKEMSNENMVQRINSDS